MGNVSRCAQIAVADNHPSFLHEILTCCSPMFVTAAAAVID
jgi:hypothetical protein